MVLFFSLMQFCFLLFLLCLYRLNFFSCRRHSSKELTLSSAGAALFAASAATTCCENNFFYSLFLLLLIILFSAVNAVFLLLYKSCLYCFYLAVNQAFRPSIHNVKFCWSRAFSGFSSNALLWSLFRFFLLLCLCFYAVNAVAFVFMQLF